MPGSPVNKFEIKKFKIRKGFIKCQLDEQFDEINEQNNAKAVRLIHDKAFGKYENEELFRRGQSRSKSVRKFVKVLQKHVKQKIESKNSVFSVMV